jgi:hypothetical protein
LTWTDTVVSGWSAELAADLGCCVGERGVDCAIAGLKASATIALQAAKRSKLSFTGASRRRFAPQW